jgi:hypothetical protein
VNAVSVAAAIVMLATTPAWAQDPEPCGVLCSPEFKIEPESRQSSHKPGSGSLRIEGASRR